MALTKECKQEMEHLLTLVERQKQYLTGGVPIADEQLLL